MTDITPVRDNPAAHRFELEQDGATAFAEYEKHGSVINFVHTEVPKELEGRGIGGRLVSQALAQVRDQGLRVQADCSFVAGYIGRHPELQDLLA